MSAEPIIAVTRSHRRVPMLHGRVPRGWCRWCGAAILHPRTHARAGQQNARANWHRDCVETYKLHAFPDAQHRFLLERDGRRCGKCGLEGCGALQVEHRTPLWKVRHIPDGQRVKYFGPENLWLNCDPCHKAKSRAEAAERAHLKRVAAPRRSARPFFRHPTLKRTVGGQVVPR